MKRIFCLFLLLCVSARAELPASVMKLPQIRSILSNNCIRVDARGIADARFSDLLIVNRRPDLLDAVQREYAAGLPPGQKPEFTVKEVAPGKYFYRNARRQESYQNRMIFGKND